MNKIREIAKEQGRTLAHLADKIGVSRTLFNYKVNTDSFTPEQRAVIAHVYGLPEHEVFPAPQLAVEA